MSSPRILETSTQASNEGKHREEREARHDCKGQVIHAGCAKLCKRNGTFLWVEHPSEKNSRQNPKQNLIGDAPSHTLCRWDDLVHQQGSCECDGESYR